MNEDVIAIVFLSFYSEGVGTRYSKAVYKNSHASIRRIYCVGRISCHGLRPKLTLYLYWKDQYQGS